MKKVIEIENLSKIYDLGLVGTGTLSKDLNRSWARLRGKTDPYATLAEINDRTKKSSSNIVYALKDINFSVEQGEVLGIIGKNGAGKSTLLKILSQITSPSTGSIKMKGRVASLLEVGTGMHPEMTARQNIYLNGSLMGMRRHEITSKLDEIVDFAGIGKYLDTPIKRFSSGMTVRLGFAVAAFLEPEILIVDEVLAVGDAEFQKKAIGKMQDVSKGEGRTVLFVSHNMGSVQSLCTRGIIIEHGHMIYDGTANESVTKYLSKEKQEINTKLIDVKNRSGNGKIQFSDFKILNSKGKEVSEMICGDSIKIQISFKIFNEVMLSKIIFAIQFKDKLDNQIFSFVTDEMGISFENSKTNIIEIIIPKLMLRGGIYFSQILITEGGTSQDEFLDKIENAFTLHVVSSDYWECGKNIRPNTTALLDGKIQIH